MTYLLARPKLRRALGEAEPTKYEEGLRDALRARLDHAAPLPADAKPLAVEAAGTESVLAALLLPQANAEKAFNRLWGLQAANGAWPWFSLDLDPWETEASQFYGAALAAAATASLPLEYRNRAGVREHVAALKSYLAGAQKTQPLHNRLALLWAASRWNALLPAGERREIVAEALEKQQPDGGWTLECLGPWKERSTAPPGEGSNAYATGFTAFVLQEAGCKPTDRAIGRARRWLASHQDAETGSWPASSMNKRYEPGSMQIRFMQDAATAFAALALLE